AYEEYRLRQQAGDSPSAVEYAQRFRIDTASWPSGAAQARCAPLLRNDWEEYFSRVASQVQQAAGTEPAALEGGPTPANGRQPTDVVLSFPKAGDTLCGFHLLCELGRGAFARVFLARQGELASRLVALKVSPAFFHDESQALAQL